MNHRVHTAAVAVAVAVAVGVGLLVVGCTPNSTPKSSPSPSSTLVAPSQSATPPSASASASPAPSASASASSATAVATACGTLISAQTMYSFNPNFTLVPGKAAPAGSAGATAVADKGVACTWVNGTSSDTVVASAAKPGATDLATLKASASSGTAVSGLGDAAYFSSSGGVGRVDAFQGAVWVAVSSSYFASAADATALVSSVLAAVGS